MLSTSPIFSQTPTQSHENAALAVKKNAPPLSSKLSLPNTTPPPQMPHAVVMLSPVVLKNGYSHDDSVTDTCSLTTDDNASLVSLLSSEAESTTPPLSFLIKPWNKKTFFSNLIQEGLRYQQRDAEDVIMLFESPSPSSDDTSSQEARGFYNSQVYKFHDYPPSPVPCKAVLGPCRYSLMNGACYPTYLREAPPAGLLEHWKATVPGFVEPSFVSTVQETSLVYAYLPMEHIKKHLNDPHVHYHLAGKDAIPLMTQKTTQVYSNTQDHRPCICKTTHSMGSKGIFVIRDDTDEAEFVNFLAESGNPNFIITEWVDIARNVACHFFLHPNGEVTWFGSNENRRTATGTWSSDSTIVMGDQDQLREMQIPFVKDVVRYCQSLGFWGLCGVDVLFDQSGKGYLVDVNPRVTGSCPALMISHVLKETHGFEYCLFRRSSKGAFPGSAEDLLRQVQVFNEQNHGRLMVIVYSFCEEKELGKTLINVGVHGNTSLDECESILNRFAPKE